MAVIGKIQKNSLLLLIVIGGAMLAFIFTDLLSNVGGGEEPTPTATIYGEEVNDEELNELNESEAETDQNSSDTAKPVIRSAPKVGRNSPCPCGSGKKYKQCCGKI